MRGLINNYIIGDKLKVNKIYKNDMWDRNNTEYVVKDIIYKLSKNKWYYILCWYNDSINNGRFELDIKMVEKDYSKIENKGLNNETNNPQS